MVVIAHVKHARVALDGGAAVLLQTPISRAQLKASLAMLGLHSAQDHTYNVLLVDDDAKALEVIAAFLPSPAYTLLRALGGREAINLARQHLPELILLDLMMPEMTGDEMLAKLRKTTWGKDLKVIVLTNVGEQEIPEEVKKLGVVAVILKADMTPSQVVDLVKKHLK